MLLLCPGAVGKAMYAMLVVQAFRPDRLLAAAHQFVAAAIGHSFMAQAEQELNLADIVETEVSAKGHIYNYQWPL